MSWENIKTDLESIKTMVDNIDASTEIQKVTASDASTIMRQCNECIGKLKDLHYQTLKRKTLSQEEKDRFTYNQIQQAADCTEKILKDSEGYVTVFEIASVSMGKRATKTANLQIINGIKRYKGWPIVIKDV